MQYLYESLDADLARTRDLLDEVYSVEGALMGEVAAYVGSTRGKMLRPCMVCLANRAFGGDPATQDDPVRVAAAVELFHTATLLHDDVIDKAPLRRGRPTVNARFGDEPAILFADYLYATSFDLALATMNPMALRLLSQTTQKMTFGEFLQIERRGSILALDDYMEIIRSKTAYLFSASCALGGLVAGAEEAALEGLARYGLEFGLAFQITDDALDYEATAEGWGKKRGADLAEGKQTLPLLLAFAAADAEDRAALEALFNNGRDFDSVLGYIRKYRAIEESLERAAAHCEAARGHLDALGLEGPAADMMRRLAEDSLARQA